MGWLVPYTVQPSKIHGLGIFATRRIRAGEKVWQFSSDMRAFGPVELGMMDHAALVEALRIGYFHQPSDRFVWYDDDMKFVNHADPPHANIGTIRWTSLEEDHSTALRDIDAGEELVEDYEFFSIFNLPSGHWIRDMYSDFCPSHYEFLYDIQARRRQIRAIA